MMQERQRRFVPIVRKVNLIIVVSLVAGIGGITAYFGLDTFATLGRSTEENLSQQSDLLYASIENAMLQGEAPIAVMLFDQIRESSPGYQVSLYRANGQRAFSDNSTIRTVNNVLKSRDVSMRFKLSHSDEPQGKQMRDESFVKALRPVPATTFSRVHTADGAIHFRIVRPLLNLPVCAECHGPTHTVRGLIDIQHDITRTIERQRLGLAIAVGLFLVVVALLAVVLSTFMRRAVIQPVRRIGDVCLAVTRGSFDQRVQVASNDEIGRLGGTVNTMVQGLYERYELSKFVSASTISSLGDSQEGRKVTIAILFSDIRGFTSYSEGHEAAEVVQRLNEVLTVQTDIISDNGGDVDKYVGDEIVAIFSGERAVHSACVAAVEIQKKFHADSVRLYDGLEVGISVHVGEVILGMVGSQRRADYTIIGDNVNVASRLCDVAKRGQVLISEEVYRSVQKEVRVEGPYSVAVKGKSERLRVYSLRAIARSATSSVGSDGAAGSGGGET